MSMTKKDYVAIAAAINRNLTYIATHYEHALTKEYMLALAIARDIADTCAQDNPRFDRARFLAACGVSHD